MVSSDNQGKEILEKKKIKITQKIIIIYNLFNENTILYLSL